MVEEEDHDEDDDELDDDDVEYDDHRCYVTVLCWRYVGRDRVTRPSPGEGLARRRLRQGL